MSKENKITKHKSLRLQELENDEAQRKLLNKAMNDFTLILSNHKSMGLDS